jgi:hypothetical protein
VASPEGADFLQFVQVLFKVSLNRSHDCFLSQYGWTHKWLSSAALSRARAPAPHGPHKQERHGLLSGGTAYRNHLSSAGCLD